MINCGIRHIGTSWEGRLVYEAFVQRNVILCLCTRWRAERMHGRGRHHGNQGRCPPWCFWNGKPAVEWLSQCVRTWLYKFCFIKERLVCNGWTGVCKTACALKIICFCIYKMLLLWNLCLKAWNISLYQSQYHTIQHHRWAVTPQAIGRVTCVFAEVARLKVNNIKAQWELVQAVVVYGGGVLVRMQWHVRALPCPVHVSDRGGGHIAHQNRLFPHLLPLSVIEDVHFRGNWQMRIKVGVIVCLLCM